MRGGLGAFGFGFGNRSLVLVENRKRHRRSECEHAVAGVTIVPSIAGAEVEVGILIGDFKLESRLTGGVLGESAADIGALQKGRATYNRLGQIFREVFEGREGNVEAAQGAGWDAQ